MRRRVLILAAATIMAVILIPAVQEIISATGSRTEAEQPALVATAAPVAAGSQEVIRGGSVVLSDPADPYYGLAEEIARQERILLVGALAEAVERDPDFVLWVVSPQALSYRALIAHSLYLRDRRSAPSVGIISGSSIDQARDLWLRAARVRGGAEISVNAPNKSAHLVGRIVKFGSSGPLAEPLTLEGLRRALQEASYLTFTGHGGTRYLRIDEDVTLGAGDLPDLPPLVVATASCNTFRLWENDSIALAFADRGAAAYAGFAYSPNEGYLMGEFTGLPFSYTWPDFPIGHVIQAQNRGAQQGFASFPYYFLLGDPRISLRSEAPYHLMDDREDDRGRTLIYGEMPAGIVPIRVPGGAEYDFVEVVGGPFGWTHEPFYNARLQMVDIGPDKYLLFEHTGGDVTLRLRSDYPLLWITADLLVDALDHALLFGQQTGGDILALPAAGVGLTGAVWLGRRRRSHARAVRVAALCGVAFALLYCGYATVRLESVTITSKSVEFSPLSVVNVLLLTSCGAFFFAEARSWYGRLGALLLAAFPLLAMAGFCLGVVVVWNLAYFRPRLGTDLYNYAMAELPAIALLFELALLGPAFSLVRRLSR